MHHILKKVALATALFVAPAVAQAELPVLSGFTSDPRTFFLAAGTPGFTIEFLYGKGSNTNTFFYSIDGAPAVKLFAAVGITPLATATPAGSPWMIATAPAVVDRSVVFTICQGNVSALGDCAGQGPFSTGVGASNVRAMSANDWNTARGGLGNAATAGYRVLGFEDFGNGNDGDFSDIVVGVNVVPEPSTYALMAFGLLGMGFVARRRRSA